jgi:putative transposase
VKAKLREDRTDATHSNQIWAMDFVHTQLATGRKLRILNIVDTHSRYTPATDPRFSYRGEDVVQTLEDRYKAYSQGGLVNPLIDQRQFVPRIGL